MVGMQQPSHHVLRPPSNAIQCLSNHRSLGNRKYDGRQQGRTPRIRSWHSAPPTTSVLQKWREANVALPKQVGSVRPNVQVHRRFNHFMFMTVDSDTEEIDIEEEVRLKEEAMLEDAVGQGPLLKANLNKDGWGRIGPEWRTPSRHPTNWLARSRSHG